jgi:hypothetical protein
MKLYGRDGITSKTKKSKEGGSYEDKNKTACIPFLLRTSCMESDRAGLSFRLLRACLGCWSQKVPFEEDGSWGEISLHSPCCQDRKSVNINGKNQVQKKGFDILCHVKTRKRVLTWRNNVVPTGGEK